MTYVSVNHVNRDPFKFGGVGRPVGPCHDGRARVGVAGVQAGRCRSSMTQRSIVLSRLVGLRCWAVSQGVGPCSLSLSQCLSLAGPSALTESEQY